MNTSRIAISSSSASSSAFVVKVSLVAALGGLLFGYDTAVIAGVIGYLQKRFELSPIMTGWAASSAIWGCAFGAMMAGYLSDRFGRKKVLILTAVLFIISSLGAMIPTNLTQFLIARFIGGLGIGAASMLSPLYISEIAPSRSRGRLVSLYQLAIVIGINLIYFVNLLIASYGDEAWNVETGWRYMLGSGTIPAVLFLLLLFIVPESPRWLVKKGKDDEAFDTLEKVNGTAEGENVLNEIKETLGQEVGTLSDLFSRRLRPALVIGIVLALFSQITGINAIIYYAPEIFKSVGFASDSALLQTVLIGAINTLFTFVALWLIDRAGRKTLLQWGVAGMVVCLFAVGVCFHYNLTSGPWLILFILAYIAFFASSLGPIPWVLISEIFPTRTRGIAMSFCTVILWVGVLAITQFTPWLLENAGGASTFWIFMLNAIVLLWFVWKRAPETKQRTLEEIEQSWKR
ncbi:sugar porter family MFS transporter [Fulvivirgaceae bacterium PWU20]|uniref:Sugar porter family MFS transporter n=2 Tax=Chryseosolibacter indicus TaxID=2782351 RepID=A0ABS5VYI7_9BACT|nr:sugar porter family MFS transporter [Chryseosolibacter indicus]